MFDYGDAIFEVLGNDATVLGILSTWVEGINTYPALFERRLIPHERKEEPVINYYRLTAIDGGSEIDSNAWTINCRATKQTISESLAYAVFDALNRESVTRGGNMYFFVTSLLPTLPLQNETDLFNTPVEAIIKARKN